MTALFSFSRSPKETPPRGGAGERASEQVQLERAHTINEQKPPERAIDSQPSPTTEQNIARLTETLKKTKKRQTAPPPPRDAMTKEVEHIMSEGLSDTYRTMTAIQRQEFKMKGEEVALEVRELLSHTKVKVKKIFSLIFSWLRLIPGVNIFFLEQEAKIKAERILRLHELHKHRRS